MARRFLIGLPLFLLLAIHCFGQTNESPAPPDAEMPNKTPAPSNTSTSPAKKVWTNDDFNATNRGVSVVGDKRNQNYHMSSPQTADPGMVSRIRKNLEKLNIQLDDTNQQLTALKNFRAGETVNDGGRQINKGLNRVPVDQQIVRLQDAKAKLEAQIGDLLDEARKKGIEPGQLR
jgi:hypothetical protein